MNGGSIYLINVSIVTRILAPVLMASVRASRSLIFLVVDSSRCLSAQLSQRGDLPLLLISSYSALEVLLDDRDSDKEEELSRLGWELGDRRCRFLFKHA